jgi:hypothetical protein
MIDWGMTVLYWPKTPIHSAVYLMITQTLELYVVPLLT